MIAYGILGMVDKRIKEPDTDLAPDTKHISIDISKPETPSEMYFFYKSKLSDLVETKKEPEASAEIIDTKEN